MFHMCASVWMCGCPTCQCFRYGANSEEAGLCGGQWTTQEAEGAFVSSLLWSLPAVTALCCVLYEGPEKMGFPGLARWGSGCAVDNDIITESPAEGSDKPAMEGPASCIHITGREEVFFSLMRLIYHQEKQPPGWGNWYQDFPQLPEIQGSCHRSQEQRGLSDNGGW